MVQAWSQLPQLDESDWRSTQAPQSVREASRHSFVYPVRGHDGAELWYLIHGGRVCAVVPAPRDDVGRRHAAARLEAVYRRDSSPPGVGEVDGVLLVAAWFRRRTEERQRTLEPAEALSFSR